MAGEIVTTAVLKANAQQFEKTIARADKQLSDLFAKARKGGALGPAFGPGGRGPAGRRGSALPPPEKTQRAIDQQARINALMRETGVAHKSASTVVRAYGKDLDKSTKEAKEYAVALDKAQKETKELTDAQRKAERARTSGSRKHQFGGLTTALERIPGLSQAALIATDGLTAGVVGLGVGFGALLFKLDQFGLRSAQVFGAFEDQILGSVAVANLVPQSIRAIADQAEQLGATTRFTATEVAAAQQIQFRAGFELNEVLAATPDLLNFASAGQLTLAEATSISADVLRTFNKDVNELPELLDVLALASASANTNIAQMGSGAKFAAPVFAALDLEAAELAAGLGVLADRGLKAELGGTGLRIAIKSLVAPTEQAKKALAGMGISMSDVDFQAIGDDGEDLVEVVELLASKGLSAADAFTIFSARGGTAMVNLTRGVKKFGRLTTKLLTEADGTTSRMAETMESGLGGSTRRLASATEALQLAYAKGYTPSLIAAQDAQAKLLNEYRGTATALGAMSGGFRQAVFESDALRISVSALDKVIFGVRETLNAIEGIDLSRINFGPMLGLVREISAINPLFSFLRDGAEADKIIRQLTASSAGLQQAWVDIARVSSQGPEIIDKSLKSLQVELKKTNSRIEDEQEFWKLLGGATAATSEETEKHVSVLAKLGEQQTAQRQMVEELEKARISANETAREAEELARAEAEALEAEREAQEATRKAEEELAKVKADANRIREKHLTAQDKINRSLDVASRAFRAGAIGVATYTKEVEELNRQLHSLQVENLASDIADLQHQISLSQPDIQTRVIVDDSELQELVDFTDDELTVNVRPILDDDGVQIGSEVTGFGGGLGDDSQLSDDLEDIGVAVSTFQENLDATTSPMDKFKIGLDNLGVDMLGFSDFLFDLTTVSIESGNAPTAGALSAGSVLAAGGSGGDAFAAGIVGASQASQFGAQQQTQFGLTEGNFFQEGVTMGAQVGGVWGAILGGFVGSFLNKGADDLEQTLTEVGGDAELVTTLADENLAELGEQITDTLESALDQLQNQVLADLDFAAAGVSIDVRGGEFVAIANGMRKVFDDVDEAMAFIVAGVLMANNSAEGLGEEMRNLALSAAAFDGMGLDELQKGLQLAAQLDFEQSGIDVNQIRQQQEILDISIKFNLSLDKTLDFMAKRAAAEKRAIRAQNDAVLGATDWTSAILERTQAMKVANNTDVAAVAFQQRRVAELESLIAAEEAGTAVLQESTQGQAEAAAATGEWADKSIDYTDALAIGTETLEDATGASTQVADATQESADRTSEYQKELEALNEQLARGPGDAFSEEEFAELWTSAIGAASLDAIDLLRTASGDSAAFAEEEAEIREALFVLELAASIRQADILIATMEFVDEAMVAVFGKIRAELGDALEGFLSGDLSLPSAGAGRGGGGRRQQKLEEERQAAEEAAQSLDDFNLSLATLELNSSTASRSLGDLATRLDDIAQAGAEALEVGANAADVRRFQQLQLRGERADILDPFRQTRPSNFATDSFAIAQQQQDALEELRLVSQAQAELLGVPFETLFAKGEAEILAGTARMETALTAGVIDALGLPLEGTRKQAQALRKAIKDLGLAHKAGAISQSQYLDLIGQIQNAQAAAIGGDLLGMIDKFYGEIEGGEDLRRDLQIAAFDLELSSLELRFQKAVLDEALAAEEIERIGGLIDFMRDNPPDWDAFFEGVTDPSGSGGTSGGISTASLGSDFSNLAGAIEDFVHSFNQLDTPRFTAQAREWLRSLEEFQEQIDELLSEEPQAALTIRNFAQSMFGVSDITQLSVDQLDEILAGISPDHVLFDQISNIIGVLQAAGGLSDVSAQAPDKILDLYRDTLGTTDQLRADFELINSEFLDAVQAMTELGATAEQLAAAEEIHQQRLQAFVDSLLTGFRSLSQEIRGGDFGGVPLSSQIDASEDRIAQLQQRLAEDPEDFAALQALEAELRNLLGLQQEFTGGVGPEFDRIVQEILGISDGIIDQFGNFVAEPLVADPEVINRMDAQLLTFNSMDSKMTEAVELNQKVVDLLRGIAERSPGFFDGAADTSFLPSTINQLPPTSSRER